MPTPAAKLFNFIFVRHIVKIMYPVFIVFYVLLGYRLTHFHFEHIWPILFFVFSLYVGIGALMAAYAALLDQGEERRLATRYTYDAYVATSLLIVGFGLLAIYHLLATEVFGIAPNPPRPYAWLGAFAGVPILALLFSSVWLVSSLSALAVVRPPK